MRSALLAMPFILLLGQPLMAQDMVIPGIWGNGLLGNNAMNNARENSRRSAGSSRQSSLPECSVELVPRGDRQRMEAEYNNILRSSGRQRANLWAQEQGRIHTRQMRNQGVCH